MIGRVSPIVTRCRRDSTCWWSYTISRHQAPQPRTRRASYDYLHGQSKGTGITAIDVT